MQTYRVVMMGLKRGVAPRDAEPLLAETFRIDVAQVRILLAQVPVKVKSAVAYARAQEYSRCIDEAGGDCLVEADPAPADRAEAPPTLQTTNGHSVIEDGIAISRIDYEPPASRHPGAIRGLKTWFAARLRRVHGR